MKLPASVGSRKQGILLAILAALLLLAVVRWRPGGAAPPPATRLAKPGADPVAEDAPAAAQRGGRRTGTKEVSPDEVPIISARDLGPAPVRGLADTGRDLFGLQEPTPRPPPTPTPAPPVPGDVRFVGPPPPPPPTPTPTPPEVNFKFLGTFGPKEHPIAVVQLGDLIFNARAGDTLFGKFVLRRVGYESIDVGFVGFPPSETRRVGITP
jgi:hypothetical protein